jgi:hypothetical protein
MIRRGITQTKMEFGKGDILTTAGVIHRINGEVWGALVCENQKPDTIGYKGKGDPVSTRKYPMLITFSNIESLDCMISALKHVKAKMKEG